MRKLNLFTIKSSKFAILLEFIKNAKAQAYFILYIMRIYCILNSSKVKNI